MCHSMTLSASSDATTSALAALLGTYAKVEAISGGRSVYARDASTGGDDAYLFYQPNMIDWSIGPSYLSNGIFLENDNDVNAVCPTDGAQRWRYWNGAQWVLLTDLVVQGNCPPSPPPPPLSPGYSCLCSNECRQAGTQTISTLPLQSDGVCDDGGPGAEAGLTHDLCEYGTDCLDCGPRCSIMPPPLPPFPPPPPTATCQCDEMILEVVGDDAGAAAARAFLAPLLGSYSMVANESASAHTVWHNPGAAFHGYLFLAVNAIWAIGPSFSAPAVWMENQVQGGPSTCPDESSGAQQWAFWNGMGWVAAPSVRVRAACPPPPPCISSYVSPSGLQLSSATSEYIQLPVILGLRSVSLWIYVEEVQDQYSWDYILDTRGRGHPEGWLAYNTFPSLRAGSAWRKMVIHDTGTGTRYAREVNDASDSLPLYIIPGGSWRHIYMESKAAYWGDDITVFGRYARGGGGDGREDCDGRFASIALWNRSLTDEEIDDLAAGGVGPSYGPGSPLVASYYVNEAVYTSQMTEFKIPDATGRHPPATAVSDMTAQQTIRSFSRDDFPDLKEECLPILQDVGTRLDSPPSPHTPDTAAPPLSSPLSPPSQQLPLLPPPPPPLTPPPSPSPPPPPLPLPPSPFPPLLSSPSPPGPSPPPLSPSLPNVTDHDPLPNGVAPSDSGLGAGGIICLVLLFIGLVVGGFYAHRRCFRSRSSWPPRPSRKVGGDGLRATLNPDGSPSDGFLPPLSSITSTPLVASPGDGGSATSCLEGATSASREMMVVASPLEASCMSPSTKNTAALQRARRFSRKSSTRASLAGQDGSDGSRGVELDSVAGGTAPLDASSL